MSNNTRIFQSIDALKDTNLCDLVFSVNGGLKVYDAPKKTVFKIETPTRITVPMDENEYQNCVAIMEENDFGYTATFRPPGYYKGQGNKKAYNVSFEFGFENKKPWIGLVEFGSSYGKITIEGVLVNISHSGGTITSEEDKKNGYSWADWTEEFYVAYFDRKKAIKVLIELIKRRKAA